MQSGGGYIWKACPAESVIRFLGAYESHPDATRADTRLIARYIKAQIAQNELTSWSVFLASSGQASSYWGRAVDINLGSVGLVERKPSDKASEKEGAKRYTIRRLVSPSDEACDLDEEQRDVALKETVRRWEISKRKGKSPTAPEAPGGLGIRFARPKSNGLLLIYPVDGRHAGFASDVPIFGFAISFPVSDTAREIEYTVNNVFTAAGDYDSL